MSKHTGSESGNKKCSISEVEKRNMKRKYKEVVQGYLIYLSPKTDKSA